ncbi:hypothetical protein B9Z19DRAFT_1124330 [Tuber borchii]|uniref:Uncharacterized protein n=1 Tax=Tuber borchii TaxID=42251 RepID=A0A2T6ZX05_TUBBO|nr:hypothetical protein B9Z19DRAFT_1124330 [Tuber borchii]
MPSTYKWKPLPAGAHGHSVNPEMIRRNKNRANLSPLETPFERSDEYQVLNDETKAEVDQEMIAEANEILEQERKVILADWRQYYPNQVDSPPNSPAPSLNPSPKFIHGSTLPAGSPPNAPPSPSSTSTLLLTLQVRGHSFTMHGAAGFLVPAGIEPAVGLTRAATFGTSHTRELILGRTRLKITLGRRNPGTNRPQGTHTSPSIPTGGEDRTSEYQLTAEDMEGDLDMTVGEDELNEKYSPLIDWVKPVGGLWPNVEVYEEWKEDEEDQDVDFMDLYESDEEDGNGSEDSEEIYGEEMIYEEEEQEEEEIDDNGDNNNDDEYNNDGDGDRSSHSLSWSENGDVEMIEAENLFWASTQEIEERLLGWAMTPKDFFTSSEDQQDRIEHIISKRKWLFAGNVRLIIDLEAAAREATEE